MMSTMIDPKIFNADNIEFLSTYLVSLSRRITESAISVDNAELMKTQGINVDEIQRIIKREKDIYEAFKLFVPMLLTHDELTYEKIIEIGNCIVGNKEGLRKDNKNDISETISIPNYEDLEQELNKLIYDYNTTWINDDTFTREAKFHINFIRMCPFPDGNHRIAILLLAYNLAHQGIAPTVISNDLTKYYDNYILEANYVEMANLFKIQSIKENLIIKDEYYKYKGID